MRLNRSGVVFGWRRGGAQGCAQRGQRRRDLARALPRPETLTAQAAQRLDLWVGRLGGALGLATARKRGIFERRAAILRPELLLALTRRRAERLAEQDRLIEAAIARRQERLADRFDALGLRLDPALHRLFTDAARRSAEGRERLGGLAARLDLAVAQRRGRLADRLQALDRMRMTLGYAETLERGFAIVRGDGNVVTTRAAADEAQVLEIEFRDGRLARGPRPPRKPGGGKAPPGQGSLF